MYTPNLMIFLGLAYGVQSQHTNSPSQIPKCEYPNSLFSKKDLQDIVEEHFSNAFQQINDKIRGPEQDLMEKYEHELKSFLIWFYHRPEQIRDQIALLENTRQVLKPLIHQVSYVANNYGPLNAHFVKSFNSTRKLEVNLEKIKSLCDAMCHNDSSSLDTPEKGLRRADYESDNAEYYCGKLKDIKTVVNITLSKFIESKKISMLKKIKDDDEILRKKLEQWKKVLGQAAFNKFGPSMYEMLNLERKYRELQQVVENNSIADLVFHIKENLYELEKNTNSLHNNITKLKNMCLNCAVHSHLLSSDNLAIILSPKLLEELLQAEEEFISKQIDETYSQIRLLHHAFDYNNPAVIENYIEPLTPIVTDVLELVRNENKKFEELNDRVPLEKLRETFILKSQIHSQIVLVNALQKEVDYLTEKYSL